MKATIIAKFIYDEIIVHHGCPQELLSNQGTSFCNSLVDALCQLMNIKHRLASAYHPQTNGLTERFNKTLCTVLAKYVSDYEDSWDTFISAALFAYRTIPQSTTKYEPFELLYGRKAITPLDLALSSTINAKEPPYEQQLQVHINFITNKLQQVQLKVQQNIETA
jgi:transposase InsO family protein